jgi:NhaP-type Na+/H+ or K+/H+ antiporter
MRAARRERSLRASLPVSSDHWYILLGVLLAGITLTSKLIEQLPMSTTMVYFAVGVVIGPNGLHIV